MSLRWVYYLLYCVAVTLLVLRVEMNFVDFMLFLSSLALLIFYVMETNAEKQIKNKL